MPVIHTGAPTVRGDSADSTEDAPHSAMVTRVRTTDMRQLCRNRKRISGDVTPTGVIAGFQFNARQTHTVTVAAPLTTASTGACPDCADDTPFKSIVQSASETGGVPLTRTRNPPVG
ncbi:hypothetical protein [Gemmatimonas sp.]|uniref:hypothetical protein n=1 Tax=Gemmatimonas sp. TaxID=1962908 RepID=UPI0037BE2A9D